MSEILELSDYQESELTQAEQESSAVERYRRLIQQQTHTPEAQLRLKRHRAWLLSALSTLLQKNPAQSICHFWSVVADQIITEAFQLAGGQETNMAIFALGKLGSYELNLSSDIDIVFVSGEDQPKNLSMVRKFQKILTENSEFGFCFRVDLDLRPGGKSGPLIPTLSQFEDYYGNFGETWERLAFVRLRPICGKQFVIDSVNKFAERYVFRKHLDYTLLDDLKILRQKIHDYYWEKEHPQDVDLKLDVGGIRDIELFVHALLVIHGGKDPSLRTHSTVEALNKIQKKNLLPADEADFLKKFYWELRQLENHVQALHDSQTHTLKHSLVPADLRSKMQKTDAIVSGLLGKVQLQRIELPAEIIEQQKWLAQMGFSEEIIKTHWPELVASEALSRNKERDEAARLKFLYEFIQALKSHSIDPEMGFLQLKDFIKATRAKATFFTLLLSEPQLIQNLARLFAASPYLSHILCARPELIDSYIYRAQAEYSDDPQALLEQLSERKLLNEILVGSEFLLHQNISRLCAATTKTADEICRILLQQLEKEYGESQLDLVLLGKWGGRELGVKSDLDFIFVTKDEPTPLDHKIARRMISRLTEPHRGGAIYNIDLRLRPSGQSGLLVTRESDLQNYLQSQAAAWERQAYLRSRFLLQEQKNLAAHVHTQPLSESDLTELHRIRAELRKNQSGTLDIKYSSGGFIDVEFAAQIALLKHKISSGTSTLEMIQSLSQHLTNWKQSSEKIQKNYLQLRSLEQLMNLTLNLQSTNLDLGDEDTRRLCQLMRLDAAQLKTQIKDMLLQNSMILKNLDPTLTPS